MAMAPTLITLLLSQFLVGVFGRASCDDSMRVLMRELEESNQYGSWAVCCERDGLGCHSGADHDACDFHGSIRATCNHSPQGTICASDNDGDTSYVVSNVHACGTRLFLNGRPKNLLDLSNILQLGVDRGTSDYDLCCSDEFCYWSASCDKRKEAMICVGDGGNIVCVPRGVVRGDTYAVLIEQGCTTAQPPTPTFNRQLQPRHTITTKLKPDPTPISLLSTCSPCGDDSCDFMSDVSLAFVSSELHISRLTISQLD
jgi:hypothetical protein